MEQPRVGGTVNRRRFLETTAGAALVAWSLNEVPPARAAARSDRARAPRYNRHEDKT
jgi:hypothetical protein